MLQCVDHCGEAITGTVENSPRPLIIKLSRQLQLHWLQQISRWTKSGCKLMATTYVRLETPKLFTPSQK